MSGVYVFKPLLEADQRGIAHASQVSAPPPNGGEDKGPVTSIASRIPGSNSESKQGSETQAPSSVVSIDKSDSTAS
ncbi:hypothetical protein NEOLEDRAFT_1130572 [Neolentinus lepideus HHB14362 ss-1]|uniref:Uncharacterized protein n=1 Tax=Neolentinus lepideus HHB14362 ss-1 TaxID=1314782 RepID=A0A165U362_9AGAM|nr:hypothetical protein NEOLEDRAFT_1130572 [Neolentinus lepideus HHB14362 ss-1]